MAHMSVCQCVTYAHALQLMVTALQQANRQQVAQGQAQGQAQHRAPPLQQLAEASCSMLYLAMTMLESSDGQVAQHLASLGVLQHAADLLLLVTGAPISPGGLTAAPAPVIQLHC